MNKKAMYNLTYGLFLLTASKDGKDNGCIINTAVQVANDPTRISIAVINKNFTCDLIKASGIFNISSITEDASFELFKHFGMQSGRDVDKFADFGKVERSENGLYYLTEAANMFLSCKVVDSMDLGSHTLFIAEVTDGEVLSKGASVTYSFYQSNIKPRPAAAAPAGDKKRYVCNVCGYIYEGDEIPDDYKCPLCQHGKEDFTLISEAPKAAEAPVEKNAVKKFVCPVCGYVYEGDVLPADFVCPTCRIPGTEFKELKADAALAAEHLYGIYGKAVKDNAEISDEDKKYIFEQLMANFTGECSEVGMYLCMARIAHREGYPEIGGYWEKAAYEEAEHAARFAELLGEDLEANMKASTRDNLAWRVDCEFGATAGKFELAKCAKKNGLDAIHDTVHEMARDEARHGKALKGLLDRYFG